MTEYAVKPGGTVFLYEDAGTDDSDKTYTVPAGKTWVINYIHLQITNTATVGNRSLTMLISNATPVVCIREATAVIPANQSGCMEFYPGAAYTTDPNLFFLINGNTPNVALRKALAPGFSLPAGASIRVYDSAAVAAAADDMVVVIQYTEYTA